MLLAVTVTAIANDEAELIGRLAAGDRSEPLQRLFDLYGGPLFGYGKRLLGDTGMAEELVQDTFVRLWRGAARFDPERGSARTWIYAIARNSAIDLQRRRSARPLSHGDSEGELLGSEEPHEQIVDRLEIRAALETIGEKHREVLRLCYDEGLSQAQIAARLSIPIGTVKTRTYHGLRAMRQELESRGFDA